MTPLQQQFSVVVERYPNASITALNTGANLITLPDMQLVPGWSLPKTTLRFLVPLGFPAAQPDCFWADQSLRLSNQQMPKNTNISGIPGTNEIFLWFSWHVAQWNPNRDNLLTYISVIKDRLNRVE